MPSVQYGIVYEETDASAEDSTSVFPVKGRCYRNAGKILRLAAKDMFSVFAAGSLDSFKLGVERAVER